MSADERDVVPVLGRWLLVVALALAILSAWINNRSADGYYALGKANSLLSQGRYSQATSLLEDTLKTYQGPQVRLSLSYAYLARRDAVRAERQVRLALPLSSPPLRPLVLAQLGRVLRFAGRDNEAFAVWDEAQEEAATYLDAAEVRSAARSTQWQSAMLHWDRGDWDDARAELELLLGGGDMYALGARVRLAQLLAPTDKDTSSRLVAESSKSLSGKNTTAAIPDLNVPGLHEGLQDAEIESVLSTLEDAQFEVNQAQQSGASKAAVLTLWGGAYLQTGENLLARSYLEQAVALQIDYEPAHARLALALFGLGDEVGALDHLATAVGLDSSDPLVHHVLARVYTARRDWSLAKEQLTILTSLQSNSVDTHLEWAEFYRLQGEYDLAEGEYIDAVDAQIASSVIPLEGTQGESTNAALILARFYTDVRGPGCEKGLPAARAAVSLRPDDPAGYDAVGWALVLCKQSGDALSTIQVAVDRLPNEPRYHFHLAHAYADLGKYAEARDQYGWVLDLDPGGSWERLALTDLVNLSTQGK